MAPMVDTKTLEDDQGTRATPSELMKGATMAYPNRDSRWIGRPSIGLCWCESESQRGEFLMPPPTVKAASPAHLLDPFFLLSTLLSNCYYR